MKPKLAPALVCTLSCAGAMAQEVLVSPPPVLEPLPLPQLGSTNALGGAVVQAPPLMPTPYQTPFAWGPFRLRPHLDYQFSYGDGIQPQPDKQITTAVHTISPGLLAEIGNHWQVDYTPSLRYYSSDEFKDGVDHAVSLNGGTRYEAWMLALSHRSALTTTPLVETGAQTDQQSHVTGLSARNELNDALSLDLGLNQNLRYTTDFNDSQTWSTMDWLDYKIAERIHAGLGIGAGYVDVQTGSDMTFEQVQGRVNWVIYEKLSFAVSGGADVRQFLDSDESSLVNPIYNASITYRLFEQTLLMLTGSRSVNPSYFNDQITENTSISAGIRQRLFGKVHLGVNGGYANSRYVASSSQVSVDRDDDHTFVGVNLSMAIFERGTIGLFYQHSENSSSQRGFSYASDQGGFRVGYHF